MLTWLMDVATMTVGTLCVVAFLYGLVAKDATPPKRSYPFHERRGLDGGDRRLEDLGPPGSVERRAWHRRSHETF